MPGTNHSMRLKKESLLLTAALLFSLADARAQTKIGGEFQVNTETEHQQGTGAVAVGQTGDFLIVWGGNNQEISRLVAQRYDSSGNSLGPPIEIDAGADLLVTCPEVGLNR